MDYTEGSGVMTDFSFMRDDITHPEMYHKKHVFGFEDNEFKRLTDFC